MKFTSFFFYSAHLQFPLQKIAYRRRYRSMVLFPIYYALRAKYSDMYSALPFFFYSARQHEGFYQKAPGIRPGRKNARVVSRYTVAYYGNHRDANKVARLSFLLFSFSLIEGGKGSAAVGSAAKWGADSSDCH